MKSSLLNVPLLLCVALPLSAQLGQPHGVRFDAQSAASVATGLSYSGLRGVARDDLGNFYVSATRATASGKHQLFRFDPTGVYLGASDQPAAVQGSATGMLDLTYDRVNQVVYGGCEVPVSGAKIFAFDIATSAFAPAKDLALPPVPLSSARALAFDSFAVQGTGSFFVCDGGNLVHEFGRSGNLIRTLTSPHPNTKALAVDFSYRLLWAFGVGGTGRPNSGVVGIAVDLTNAQPNGLVALGDPTVGGTVGGVEFEISGHDHTVAKFVILEEAASDMIYSVVAAFRSGSTCGGIIGMAGDAPYSGNAGWKATLSGSSAAQGFLLVHAKSAITPVTPPLFGLGCAFYVSFTPAPVILGPVPVLGGFAQLTVPIPPGLPAGDIAIQWLETSNPIVLPVALSDGGRTHIYN